MYFLNIILNNELAREKQLKYDFKRKSGRLISKNIFLNGYSVKMRT
jgi:hypothetical protein